MAFPSVTYTFTNGSTADATQVNQNYTDLINGLSDGTKSLNVSAITALSTVTLSGNVTVGLSSTNTLTINSSIAANIVFQTNGSFDLGGSTIGAKSLYLGGTSTFTTRLLGATLGASYTYTFPASAGTTGQSVKTDGVGVTRFEYPDNVIVAAKTGNYGLTGVETVVFGDATSTAFTFTVPLAASFPYKRFTLFRKDTTFANSITVARTSADTFTDNVTTAATSTTLSTGGESIDLVSDGVSVWYILNRKSLGPWVTTTPTGSWVSNATYSGFYRRNGEYMDFAVKVALTGSPTNASLSINLPTGVVIDTTKIVGTLIGDAGPLLGLAYLRRNATGDWNGTVFYNSTTSVVIRSTGTGGSTSQITNNNLTATLPFNWANTDALHAFFSVPIVGWVA